MSKIRRGVFEIPFMLAPAVKAMSRVSGVIARRTDRDGVSIACCAGMSQKNVEILIWRLANEDALRDRFSRDPESTLRELGESGLALSRSESEVLLERPGALTSFIESWLDSPP